MTQLTTSLNFTFRSFGEDVTSTEELFIIDDRTVVFNQDTVHTASMQSIVDNLATVILHLKDGITLVKEFDISSSDVIAR